MFFLKSAAITLFGSSTYKNNIHYDKSKSLLANFNTMCSLPLHKHNSPETNNLIATLKNLQLTGDDKISDNSKLFLARAAIEEWLRLRTGKSERTIAVGKFLQAMQTAYSTTGARNLQKSSDGLLGIKSYSEPLLRR